MTFDDFKSDFVVHRMHDGEYVEAFECGENDLNNFIMHDASLYLNEKLAVTYIVYKKDNPKKVEAFLVFLMIAFLLVTLIIKPNTISFQRDSIIINA